ncbi:MAG: UDP-N-acetylmuramoyl-tripeptide--D-alanyl-D-alanine ligase [Clostridiales bacterium]|nr:UDP-N-acetylmuramoyl-tripeptide--D-alanyl-D-alanine ligase [Clostridiales bacterium]
MNIEIRDVLIAVRGTVESVDVENTALRRRILGVSTDSREDMGGKLFVPLKGPKFDGHDYIGAAIEKGAAAVLTERRDVCAADILSAAKSVAKSGMQGDPCVIIHVESTYQALRDLAEWHRARFDIPAVAITGSAGKTTTKDMIASVLSQRFVTLKTDGNLNNEIGLPLMALRLNDTHEAAVFEMGMNHLGEIRNLSKIIKPHVCVITNIGTAHMEFLGSRENILRAKCEIFEHMRRGGAVILNADDDMLGKIVSTGTNNISYGIHNGDMRAINIKMSGDGQRFDVVYKDVIVHELFVPLPGEHNVLNALAAAAVGFALGLSGECIQEGLRSFPLSKNRMEFIRTDRFTIINDVYNANPQSMIAALDVLSQMASYNSVAGRKPQTIAILGDMFELGEFSQAHHEQIGRHAAELGIDYLITIGKAADFIRQGFINNNKDNGGHSLSFAAKEEAEDALPKFEEFLQQGDIILIKASRGMQLETTVAKVKEMS